MPYSFTATTDIQASTIVKFDEDGITTAQAKSDNLIGIAGTLGYCEGDTADVYMTGERVEVVAGGAFSKGDMLTSDAQGKAVKADNTSNIVAIALDDAVEGDIVNVIVNIQRIVSE